MKTALGSTRHLLQSSRRSRALAISVVIVAVALSIAAPSEAQVTSSGRSKVWTLSELRVWSIENMSQKWKGQLLYQGSDSNVHHFISRVFDDWIWFLVRRNDLTIVDERPYRRNTSATPLGYYFINPSNNFVKTADY